MRSVLIGTDSDFDLLDYLVPLKGEGSWEATLDELRFSSNPYTEYEETKKYVIKKNAKRGWLDKSQLNQAIAELKRAANSTSLTLEGQERTRDEELSREPETRPYTQEAQHKDYIARYTVYVDQGIEVTEENGQMRADIGRYVMPSLQADSIVEWSRAARRQSQQFTARVDISIIDRCDAWDGFVIRDRHIMYTRAIWHIRTDLPRRQPGDFTVGAVIISPGSHAVCGYCNWSVDLDVDPSRNTQEELTLSIIEHSLNAHDPQQRRQHVVPSCVRTYLTSTEGKFPAVGVEIIHQHSSKTQAEVSNPWA